MTLNDDPRSTALDPLSRLNEDRPAGTKIERWNMRHFRVGGTAFVGLCLLALLGATAVAQDAASIEGAW